MKNEIVTLVGSGFSNISVRIYSLSLRYIIVNRIPSCFGLLAGQNKNNLKTLAWALQLGKLYLTRWMVCDMIESSRTAINGPYVEIVLPNAVSKVKN